MSNFGTSARNTGGVDVERVDREMRELRASRWLSSVFTPGSLPRIPQLATLPTAAAAYEGRLVYVPFAGTTAGALYCCLLAADGVTWNWQRLDQGTIAAIIAATALGGELAGTVASGTVAATHSGSAHSIILRYSSTAEVTTTSTSAVDLWTSGALSIPITSGVIVKGVVRKTAGAAAYAGIGWKINSTVISEARSDGVSLSFMQLSNANAAEPGSFTIELMPRSTNYTNYLSQCIFTSALAGAGVVARFGNAGFDASPPQATITSIALRGITASASQTLAVKEVAVYEVLYS